MTYCFSRKNRFPAGGMIVMLFVAYQLVGFEPFTVFSINSPLLNPVNPPFLSAAGQLG
jgi:hypothetical protein